MCQPTQPGDRMLAACRNRGVFSKTEVRSSTFKISEAHFFLVEEQRDSPGGAVAVLADDVASTK